MYQIIISLTQFYYGLKFLTSLAFALLIVYWTLSNLFWLCSACYKRKILLKFSKECNHFTYSISGLNNAAPYGQTILVINDLSLCICQMISVNCIALLGSVHTGAKCTKTSLISQCHYQIFLTRIRYIV